jgi:hypothetical protein
MRALSMVRQFEHWDIINALRLQRRRPQRQWLQGSAGDCVCRSITIATGLPCKDVYRDNGTEEDCSSDLAGDGAPIIITPPEEKDQ